MKSKFIPLQRRGGGMTRYRAVILGRPQPWRCTREMAEQDAYRAGKASRETSRPYVIHLDKGVELAKEG